MNNAQLQSAGLFQKGADQIAALGEVKQFAGVWMNRIARRHEFRETFVPLLQERDEILSDIGYQRPDIQRALKLPLSNDAMAYMEQKRQFHEQQSGHTRLTR